MILRRSSVRDLKLTNWPSNCANTGMRGWCRPCSFTVSDTEDSTRAVDGDRPCREMWQTCSLVSWSSVSAKHSGVSASVVDLDSASRRHSWSRMARKEAVLARSAVAQGSRRADSAGHCSKLRSCDA